MRDSIKYANSVTSKQMKGDVEDEMAKLNKIVSDLRVEIKALVGEQHEYYLNKLKNYTDVVSKSVFDVLAEAGIE